jgi:hypothetical protein
VRGFCSVARGRCHVDLRASKWYHPGMDIPRHEEFYDGDGPFYACHFNGRIYAIFAGANDALAYWRGLDAGGRTIFHLENAEGKRITLRDNPYRPWHATAILDALDRAS